MSHKAPRVLTVGEAEEFKAAAHAWLAAVLAAFATYNWICLVVRPDRHLTLNAVVFTSGMLFEARNAWRHLRGGTE